MSTKAFLFDLDGTLLNTLPDITYITNMTLREFGFPERTQEEMRVRVGYGIRYMIGNALPDGVPLTDEILLRMRENYVKYQNQRIEYYPGVNELLQKLKEKGLLLAIVSNKIDPATLEIADTRFPGLIDFAIGARENMRTKPAPDLVNEAVRVLGISKEECYYVGDSEVDILTARNADIRVLSVTWGFRPEELLLEHGATDLIRTPREILRYL